MNEKWAILSEIRKLQDISQDEIAEKLNVNRSSIARLEAGIPALSAEYTARMCEILQINNDFLYNKAEYPFVNNAFLKFKIKGLSYRLRPLFWIDMLAKYSDKLYILLLLREGKNNVLASFIKDDHDSLFVIGVDIPLTWQDVFDFIKKQPEKKRHGISVHAKPFFNSRGELGPYDSYEDIAHFSHSNVDRLIEESLSEVLSDEEKKIIQLVRKHKIPMEQIKKLIREGAN